MKISGEDTRSRRERLDKVVAAGILPAGSWSALFT